MFKRLIFATALMLAGAAHAVLPDGGWYWNPAESGRGFNIEIQDNILFVAGFIYDAQGKPIWLVSGGPMSSDRTYTGQLFQTPIGGQCIGCFYPGAPVEVDAGTISITFNGTNATILVNGTAIAAERMQFGLDFTSVAQPLLGEWSIVQGDTTFPVYFGERIRFTAMQVSQGQLAAVGSRAGSAISIAVGYFVPALGKWVVLLDSSTSYYRFYVFSFPGFDRIEGDSYLYKKTESPTLSSPFVAQRIKSATAARGASGPGTGKIRMSKQAVPLSTSEKRPVVHLMASSPLRKSSP